MKPFTIPDMSITHEIGAERYGVLWLRSNERAAAILREAGVDFDSRSGREYAALVSAVVLETLHACATGPAIRLLTRAAVEQRLDGALREL